jgi:hypothetical protein
MAIATLLNHLATRWCWLQRLPTSGGWLVATLCLLAAPPVHCAEPIVISEFLASNTQGLQDDHGVTSDWVELRNRSAEPVSLAGYALTDNPARPRLWVLPDLALPAGQRLVVFASGRDQRDPEKPLHTSFKLSGEGEYLALSAPDGQRVQAFEPKYPPQFPNISYGDAVDGSEEPWFLPSPTPGQPNLREGTRPGPILTDPTHTPLAPTAGQPIRVSIRVSGRGSPRRGVAAFYRFDFQPENAVPLEDSGQNGDAQANDGVWTGTLPTTTARGGSMIRWRFAASTVAGGKSRWPLFPDPADSARYLGTVVNAATVTSALPVFHLFVDPSDPSAMDTDEGTRASLFHDGEFYDNLLTKIRGNTTAGFPKKSHRLEFTPDHPFRHPGPGPRIRNTSLMAEWGDPTYLRQHLSFWLMNQAGTPAPFHEPVRVQLNGQFFQLAMHSQVLGEELLERTGLDPDGALYKAVGTVTPDGNSTGGFEKKTRRQEDTRDYTEFARALGNPRRPDSRVHALFDRCDLPAVLNYIAIARITQEDDDIWANLSLYRDSDGTGRWRPVAFDMNVSWGLSFGAGGILADEDEFRSHPLWGAADIGDNQGFNRLYNAVIQIPVTREMLLRRMRTLMDRFLQPPGTPPAERVLENHIEQQRRRMAPEAVLDRQQWGLSWNSPRGSSPARDLQLGIQDLTRRFIEPRRVHLYVTHAATNRAHPIGVGTRLNAGIPGPQPEGLTVTCAESGRGESRQQDWLRLSHTNAMAVDLSGWSLAGDVTFTFPPGTVLPAQGDLIAASNLIGFQSRTTSPKPGEQRLVVGGFKGSLAKAREIRLVDVTGRVVDRWQPR